MTQISLGISVLDEEALKKSKDGSKGRSLKIAALLSQNIIIFTLSLAIFVIEFLPHGGDENIVLDTKCKCLKNFVISIDCVTEGVSHWLTRYQLFDWIWLI